MASGQLSTTLETKTDKNQGLLKTSFPGLFFNVLLHLRVACLIWFIALNLVVDSLLVQSMVCSRGERLCPGRHAVQFSVGRERDWEQSFTCARKQMTTCIVEFCKEIPLEKLQATLFINRKGELRNRKQERRIWSFTVWAFNAESYRNNKWKVGMIPERGMSAS